MRVLVACEFSGVVREAFRSRGHDALSCDIDPTELPGPHYQGDVRDILGDGWDMMIAHPPCTYLSRAGARWWKEPGREQLTREALAFVLELSASPIEHIAIENPIGRLNQLWRYPDQTIQPFWFGHPYSKATCLWLKNLPRLTPSKMCYAYKPYLPSNTGAGRRSGQSWDKGEAGDWQERAKTFEGIAAAMADQWGGCEHYADWRAEQLAMAI